MEKLFKEAPPRLEREFDTLIDVYEKAFGADAADAFRKAIRAWHAGVEVIGETMPTSRPLAASIDAGVFGIEEDGTNVNPGEAEVAAITECVADALMNEPSEPERIQLLKKYGDDFGPKAAEELERWSRLKRVQSPGCRGLCGFFMRTSMVFQLSSHSLIIFALKVGVEHGLPGLA